MKNKVLSVVSKVIEGSVKKEFRRWPPVCDIGTWYQPQRPAAMKTDSVPLPEMSSPKE